MVKGLSMRLLAVVGAAAFMASWIADLISERVGGPLLALPLATGIALLAFAVVLLVLGLRVRRMRDGDAGVAMDRTWGVMTAALAQSAALLGALALGWHAFLSLDQAMLLAVRSQNTPLWVCLAQVGVGAVLVVVGWIVERFCRLPPEDPEAEDARRETGSGGAVEEGGMARNRDGGA